MNKEPRTMQVADAATASRAPENTPAMVKKIGKTTYKVHVHFSNTSTETMSDKIKRMLMMLYNTGTRLGLIHELRLMQCYLMPDETALRELSVVVIEKLKLLTDAEFAELEFPLD